MSTAKKSVSAAVTLSPDKIVDGDALRVALTASFREHAGNDMEQRAAVLELLKTTMADGRAVIREALEAGMKGIKTAQCLCYLQDVIIQALYDYCRVHAFPSAHHTEAENICIVAVGGYGRGTLAPQSDIDLLFVLPHKQTPWGESVVEYMLYMLWDLGLKVGHATRSVNECIRLSREDITIRTTILEARYLWGHEPLFDDLMDAFWNQLVPGTGREFVRLKLEERDERHARAGQSRYLVEPNIKESKGGLRDLQTLFWIGKYLYGVQDPRDLVKKGVFRQSEMRTFMKADEFLWAVRCHLHFVTGRPEDRLSFDIQIEMARRLGYTSHGGMKDVERFMKHYFLVAKDVGDLTRIFCATLEDQQRKAAPASNAANRLRNRLEPLMQAVGFGAKVRRGAAPLPPGFVLDGARINADTEDLFSSDPVNIIRLFHTAEMNGTHIHPDALRLVRRSLKLVDASLRKDEEANRLFCEILVSEHTPDIALRRMNEAGVLGRFVLDFGRIVALMQFNMYHHYTADEHLIYAIHILSGIEKGVDADQHRLANDLMQKVQSRKVIYLAMFLHDIAKGRPEDHSIAGAKIARKLGPRLGLTPAETDTVEWLVLEHLIMSDVAQTRDISDPRTVKDFADKVQSPERLKLLTILTTADIKAVGPGVWNGWKAQLIEQLYDETLPLLSGKNKALSRTSRVDAAKDAFRIRMADLGAQQVEALIARQTPSYWLVVDPDTQERHARLMAGADESGGPESVLEIGVTPLPDNEATEITVLTPDHAGLFSRIAGAVDMTGANIVDAKIFTTTDGMALDTFWVQSDNSKVVDEERRVARLKELIEKNLRGQTVPKDTIARERKRTRRQQAFEIEPQVIIDNTASERFTLIEVNALDRPGILYDLTRALFHLNLTITSAHIATYGERIVDVFYVKDVTGGKVVQDGKKEAVTTGLISAINSRLSPQPKDVKDRVQKRTERREAARETGKKARAARTKRLKGAAE
ncbi:[protein-PII] uridylyltransferase [Pyruvatibacter sp. HU-CL02332]|uniref:[protein-PII] uridylyltransferase n=1 Tax=Pyruvatibacter sp. HU-CL02332 TaxID=3127650 RepID=UPI003105775A